ncbi:MAG: hypothetical protein GF320_11260, partial [Armatimonadia bacterium]|nr:hypothetical protein [Armatimonadia bacterium]
MCFGYVGGLGYYHDQDLSMPLLSIRHYQPRTGLFIARDPVLTEPRYQYVGGLPTARVDASGTIHQLGSGLGGPIVVMDPELFELLIELMRTVAWDLLLEAITCFAGVQGKMAAVSHRTHVLKPGDPDY